jgi:hypothetical protein
VTAPAGDPGSNSDRERAFGLLLFDAEESLARGEAEKAMVMASRAVKERPDSLTARALIERARRELTRGRRREKLEARIVEAQSLLEAGDFAASERIVSSALKLVPDHPVALVLFGRLRDRPRATTAEMEADRELERLARAQAEKALEAARAARAAGWDRRAIVHLRRGLRLAPDHPELLALLRETHGALERLDAERVRKRALTSQARAGLGLLAQADLEGALRILRAVLDEDPDNARAQAGIQEVRRAFLSRGATAQPPGPRDRATVAAPGAEEELAPAPVVAPAPRTPARLAEDPVADRSLPFVPVEILLPRTRRHRTPPALILIGGALLGGALLHFSGRGGVPGASPSHPPAGDASVATAPQVVPSAAPAGPLSTVEPLLRQAIVETIGAYGKALETADAGALAEARPDLSREARRERLAPFIGALNAATDVRVLEVAVTGDSAVVSLLCTDVIIGGRGAARQPFEESLRFERRRGAWALSGGMH